MTSQTVEDAPGTIRWRDDAQVVDLVVRKRYANVGAPVGCFVRIEERGPC